MGSGAGLDVPDNNITLANQIIGPGTLGKAERARSR